ncbi:MAG: hypothetical protein GY716_18410 [bacterium]|nr:hypothetical protein [bacterium]
MSTYARLSDLPLAIEEFALDGMMLRVSSEFERYTTIVRLEGRGAMGIGEDVTYDSGDQLRFQKECKSLELPGSYTLDSFSSRLDELALFPQEPRYAPSLQYRRWAFESAALDLALRQAGRPLHDALRLEPAPVRFVVSRSLGHPPSVDALRAIHDGYPGMEFKLDANPAWDDELLAELSRLGTVRTVDLKGAYEGTPVDGVADAELYRRVAEALPDVWLEDPALTDETRAALAGHERRITWDAPIHSVQDVLDLPFAPRMLNIKPSRFGSLRALFDTYDHCNAQGISMYGGGQFELGPGRTQLHVLASLFHPGAPNDVAPTGFHANDVRAGLPTSPIRSDPAPAGFTGVFR